MFFFLATPKCTSFGQSSPTTETTPASIGYWGSRHQVQCMENYSFSDGFQIKPYLYCIVQVSEGQLVALWSETYPRMEQKCLQRGCMLSNVCISFYFIKIPSVCSNFGIGKLERLMSKTRVIFQGYILSAKQQKSQRYFVKM